MEDIIEEIMRLKRERKAIILAHVYQPEEIQEIADFSGDSFGLSQKAAATDAEVIVFCGVRFMAETANILSPDKITLLPAVDAGCQMFTDAITGEVRKAREEHPEALIVSYVNTPAAVKAMSDICCTSSNAAAVVASLPRDKEVIFVPDANLASWAETQCGRKLLKWQGGCPIHGNLTVAEIQAAKEKYPQALVLMHPECRAELCALADYVGSTSGIIKFAEESEAEEFIIATEEGVMYELTERCPQKKFHLASRRLLCVNMKKTTLEKVRDALLTMEPQVVVPEDIRLKSVAALERMLAIKGETACSAI
ncbi:quinolinate synthase NadA [Selenomonas ruminantium]|uniref:Quinolinate synthase n=1 Tax=Selenomonas ruminantium TaxID=971 RepID=A0A1H0MFH5_SELRU|nr:quinolinate synthase NadA [Selenomonas ruminantium]SDO79016.1 quinolinate synthetase [Selenomonas ruminantium]